MRMLLVTLVSVALGASGTVLAPTAFADESTPAPVPVLPAQAIGPQEALEVATRVLEGEAEPADPSATLALRDLWVSRDGLTGAQRRTADALLARPTDGPADWSGYTTPAKAEQKCNPRICVHYMPAGYDADSVPSEEWAIHTRDVVDRVWEAEVTGLGYRAPISDKNAGGTPQFDVYLKDLGPSLYGYCTTDPGPVRRVSSGYCVLDNDYSASDFPSGTPDGNLRVTAAHEFFHAVQYAYDALEDRWMMESTATWVEERVADDVDDNRWYLPAGQLYAPQTPIDTSMQGGSMQYGNWIFWEFLSTRHGVGIVRSAWNAAGAAPGDGGAYSFRALERVLGAKGGLTRTYAKFASGNLVPAATYPEGSAYRSPRVTTRKLSRTRRKVSFVRRLDHMTSHSLRLKPARNLRARQWKLRLRVDAPARRTSPRAQVVLHLADGRTRQQSVRLDRAGRGTLGLRFDRARLRAVSVTLVNASTRMQCGTGSTLACQGRALDDDQRYALTARLVRR